MTVIGICVLPSGAVGRTSASVVVAAGTRAAPMLVDSFTIKTPAVDNSEKIVDLARGISSKLTGLSFTDVVVRTADFNAARGASGSSLGPQCEGAIVAVLRERIDRPLLLRSGRDIGVALGIPKVDAEDAGKRIAPGHAKAGAAALSALPE